jgi:hypothetical protein
MHETKAARGTGRMELTLKSVMALALFTIFVCKKTNKTLNSKTFK